MKNNKCKIMDDFIGSDPHFFCEHNNDNSTFKTCDCGGTIETSQSENGFSESWYCLKCGKEFKTNPFIEKPCCNEIVICAAIKSSGGQLFQGHRHCDCYAAMFRALEIKSPVGGEIEGFITSKNRFVDRREAFEIQKAAGIKSASRDGYEGNQLYSEDLY